MIAVARFPAFIYTYHYLNWFSKTRVIRWHEVSGRRLAGICALYATSLLLYAYDHRLGLAALVGLSHLHVLLELPLDLRVLAEVGRSLSSVRVGSGQSAVVHQR